MISVSKKNLSSLTKIVLSIIVIYTVGFMAMKLYDISQNSKESEKLQAQLQKKKNETKNVKAQIKIVERRTQKLNDSYLSKEELEGRLSKIFERMSVLDYKLTYLDSQKMCLDRYIVVSQVNAKSEEGRKAALGILSYLGQVKQSEQSENIYFLDFILEGKKK